MSKEFEENTTAAINGLNSKVNNLTSEVSNLNVKVNKLETEVSNLNVKVNKLETEVNNLNVKVDKIESEVSSINVKIDEHTEQLTEIKRYLILIEDKLSNQIPALFDAYNMNVEIANQIKVNQEATDKKVEINSFKISELEKTSKIHDKELKKILAN